MTYQEKQELLANSMKQLTTHPAFIEFEDALKILREEAIISAVSDKTFKTQYRTVAALGEVRAYTDILNVIEEHRNSQQPSLEPGAN